MSATLTHLAILATVSTAALVSLAYTLGVNPWRGLLWSAATAATIAALYVLAAAILA